MLTDGKQIAAARQLLGWSQGDLAAHAGVSKPSVIRIEKELNSVKFDVQTHIQKAIEQNNIEFLDQCGVRENTQTLKRYRGQAGFREFYDDLYATARDQGGDICLFNGVSTLVATWLGEDYLKIHKDRMDTIKNNFTYKIIFEEGDTDLLAPEYCQYKWFPSELFTNKSIWIYGDKVAFATFTENDVELIVLKQAELAEAQTLLFNLAWNYQTIEESR